MADGFVPPQEVRNNAKRGLELREKHGRGGTEVGVARARDLSNGKALSLDTINRMISYFARHEVDKQGEGWGKDSAGYIAWLLWGGDAGRAWAKSVAKQNDKKEKSTVNDLTTAFFEIVKSDRNSDGTMMVYGKATDDSLDIDQQICDPVWLDRAMPEWFKSGGNIREQHSSIAAGVAKEYEKKSDGHYIHALVVDPISVKKVDTGVLKGFSIGIKSPRVVRDEKAANGRIIDGQIVEVSLVDRPANPNCQLVLAKSVNGETGVWKVEELIEKSDEVTPEVIEETVETTEDISATQDLPTEEVVEKKEKKPDYEGMLQGGGKSEPADKDLYNRIKGEAKKKFDVYPSAVANAWVVREYKKRGGKYKANSDKSLTIPASIMSDILKFDKAEYEAARNALANLISVEAEAMKEGHNEIASISHLLESVAHLHAWYEGEEAEGEVMENEESIEMSAHTEDEKMHHDEDKMKYAMCKECDKSEKECACEGGFVKSTEAHKCLECGCGIPQDSHGRSDVSTAEMVSPADTPKSAEGEATEEVATEETPAEEAEEKDSVEEISAEDVEAIVEKAVKSATDSVRSEVALLISAKEAALTKAATLESELATAKSLAASGGPKRTLKPADASNDLLTKALAYKAKANATTDPTLAKGYKALYQEFLDKANGSDAK
jgi:hypothetical protein